MDELQNQIRERDHRIGDLESARALADVDQHMKAEIEAKNEWMAELDGEIAKRDSTILELQKELDTRVQSAASLKGTADALSAQVSALQKELDDKNGRFAEIEDELARSKVEQHQLRHRTADWEDQLHETREEITRGRKSERAEKVEMEQQLDARITELERELEGQKSLSASELNKRDARIRELEVEVETGKMNTGEFERRAARISELEEDLEVEKTELKRREDRIDELQRELQAVQSATADVGRAVRIAELEKERKRIIEQKSEKSDVQLRQWVGKTTEATFSWALDREAVASDGALKKLIAATIDAGFQCKKGKAGGQGSQTLKGVDARLTRVCVL